MLGVRVRLGLVKVRLGLVKVLGVRVSDSVRARVRVAR